MKKYITIACMIVSLAGVAQSDKDAVSSAVMDYVDAFYYGDSMKLHRSISPQVVKYGYYRPKDSTGYAGEPMSFQAMINYVAAVKKRNNPSAADKFVKKVEVLDVQDQTAAAKLTAWWGTDYLLLAKQGGKWMITHVLWQSPPR
ncbi:MAG TPA: nuclear transport factor 2 family protein [Chitinophagaceae bacterium]|nr:nuclear transport factor 2 family protein [Chitinophagaceae bacterium]